jgi:hypothetical protein
MAGPAVESVKESQTSSRRWLSRSRAFAEGLDGPARERANDDALLAAGIQPGHPSLYPASLADVFAADAPPGGEGAVRRVP